MTKRNFLPPIPVATRREQDIFDPLHYLPLLEQRPGAFDYAAPMKQWRKEWPQSYHQCLQDLQREMAGRTRGAGIYPHIATA